MICSSSHTYNLEITVDSSFIIISVIPIILFWYCCPIFDSEIISKKLFIIMDIEHKLVIGKRFFCMLPFPWVYHWWQWLLIITNTVHRFYFQCSDCTESFGMKFDLITYFEQTIAQTNPLGPNMCFLYYYHQLFIV